MKFKKADVLRLKGRKNSQKNDIFWDVILVIKANMCGGTDLFKR